jgi:hypothetical protein
MTYLDGLMIIKIDTHMWLFMFLFYFTCMTTRQISWYFFLLHVLWPTVIYKKGNCWRTINSCLPLPSQSLPYNTVTIKYTNRDHFTHLLIKKVLKKRESVFFGSKDYTALWLHFNSFCFLWESLISYYQYWSIHLSNY